MSINILIPTHYEMGNVSILTRNLSKLKTSFKLLFIYDDNKDPTISEIKNLKKNLDIDIQYIQNSGKGIISAYNTGFKYFNKSKNPILVLMCDLSDDTDAIDSMYQKWLLGNQIIFADRYSNFQLRDHLFNLKILLSYYGNKLLNLKLKNTIHDYTNNFRLYDSSFIQNNNFQTKKGFEFSLETTILAINQNLSICKVNVKHNFVRKHGKTKFNIFGNISGYIFWLIKILKI